MSTELVAPPPYLLGRRKEFSRMLEYVSLPRVQRVLVLWGPAGSGRTSLIKALFESVSATDVAIKRYADLSPAPRPLGLQDVVEVGLCYGNEPECIDRMVKSSLQAAEATGEKGKILIAIDGIHCLQRDDCGISMLIRSLARLIETFPEKLRIILSIDDQEAVLELGSVAEYMDVIVVEGLPKDAAVELLKREALKASVALTPKAIEDIVAMTGGLPYHMLTIIHEYKGNTTAWLKRVAFNLNWKLTYIASNLHINVREVAKHILDLIDKPIATIPRHAFDVLRLSLRTNITYLAAEGIVRPQLPVYRGLLHEITYRG